MDFLWITLLLSVRLYDLIYDFIIVFLSGLVCQAYKHRIHFYFMDNHIIGIL